MIQDQPGKKKAFGEEIDTKGMKSTDEGEYLSKGRIKITYKIHKKKTTSNACEALNWTAFRLLFRPIRSSVGTCLGASGRGAIS